MFFAQLPIKYAQCCIVLTIGQFTARLGKCVNMADSSTTPDLQAILQTLAQFAAPVGSETSQEKGSIQSDIVEPSPMRLQPTPSTLDPRSRPASLTPRPQSRSSAVASPKPIDPATITTWQDGLRCVTKIAAQNAQFAATIRRVRLMWPLATFRETIDTFVDDGRSKEARDALVLGPTGLEAEASKPIWFCCTGTFDFAIARWRDSFSGCLQC